MALGDLFGDAVKLSLVVAGLDLALEVGDDAVEIGDARLQTRGRLGCDPAEDLVLPLLFCLGVALDLLE